MKNLIMAIILTFGLVAGGSDSVYFPIPNIAGVAAIAVFAVMNKSIRGE